MGYIMKNNVQYSVDPNNMVTSLTDINSLKGTTDYANKFPSVAVIQELSESIDTIKTSAKNIKFIAKNNKMYFSDYSGEVKEISLTSSAFCWDTVKNGSTSWKGEIIKGSHYNDTFKSENIHIIPGTGSDNSFSGNGSGTKIAAISNTINGIVYGGISFSATFTGFLKKPVISYKENGNKTGYNVTISNVGYQYNLLNNQKATATIPIWYIYYFESNTVKNA